MNVNVPPSVTVPAFVTSAAACSGAAALPKSGQRPFPSVPVAPAWPLLPKVALLLPARPPSASVDSCLVAAHPRSAAASVTKTNKCIFHCRCMTTPNQWALARSELDGSKILDDSKHTLPRPNVAVDDVAWVVTARKIVGVFAGIELGEPPAVGSLFVVEFGEHSSRLGCLLLQVDLEPIELFGWDDHAEFDHSILQLQPVESVTLREVVTVDSAAI